ncbi:MAG: glycosyltransferase family 2 protein [Candidatus Micrarchaeia archaeon]|jgi:dolichol-phosphate mannosyltransferase
MKQAAVIALIPTLNEERGIGKVISAFNALKIPNSSILVVDGHSKDATVKIARKMGAKVVFQKEKGKGAALLEAVATIPDDATVVLVDADNTYDLKNVKRMIGLVGENTMVQGRRVVTPGSMTLLNWLGNLFFNGITIALFLHFHRDLLTGLRVFKAGTFKRLGLKAKNFEIETEMTLKAIKKGVRIIEVPASYWEREGLTKLRPLQDGIRILRRIIYERFNE